MKKYFVTKSKTLAMALNYLNYSYYKFNDKEDENVIIYSFELKDEDSAKEFYEKLDRLNDIKFN